MTKREQILAAVKTKLQTMSSISSSKVFRSRVDPFLAENLPGVTIEPAGDVVISATIAYIDWKLNVRIITFTQGETPDQVADPIIAEIHSKMMSDETLGGLLMGMAPIGLHFEFLESGTPKVAITYDFELTYRTT